MLSTNLQRELVDGGLDAVAAALELLQGKRLPDSIDLTAAASNAAPPREMMSKGFEWSLEPWPEDSNTRYEHN